MAQSELQVQVVAPAYVPGPEVFVINGFGIAVGDGTVVIAHNPFHVRGIRFRPGPVYLYVDDPGGPFLGSVVVAEYHDNWETTISWPVDVLGRHRFVAVEADLTATSVELVVQHHLT